MTQSKTTAATTPKKAAPATAPTRVPVDLSPTKTVVRGFGRIPVTKVSPVIEGGAYAAKATVGELVPIRARVFREGHDAVNASVIVTDPSGRETRHDMTPLEPRGLDPWEAWVRFEVEGAHTFRVEGWSDPWGTWLHNAEAKLPAGVDIELVCMEGRDLFERTAKAADEAGDPVEASILRATAQLLIPQRPAEDLLDVATGSGLAKAMRKYGPRELVSPTAEFPIFVDRRKALFASWYEFFPRSEGATYDAETDTWTSGTFDDCHQRLEEVAAMGFDVVYFPPIHPIGTAFKKGKNNSLDATEKDPGSPWAVGSPDGGHDAIHPDLGDWESFDRLVAKAKQLGIEIALDFALQASPDHPWVTDHPEWFTTRLDGTIAYAENPPKKYQDIYPINFDNDPEGIYNEVLRVLRLWMSHGVRIFRVDNPHTKPVQFWAWIFDQIRATDPDVLFFAEAFTKPEMMHALGKVGFHTSYTYFTWRVTKHELVEYMGELSRETDAFYRPNFFVNTPDINPFHLQSGNPAIFAIRAILASMLSPAWGVYSGFELFEHVPNAPGREEYLDSEKYEFRPRDYNAQPNLNMLMGTLNAIRQNHRALQQLRQVDFHTAPHEKLLAFSKVDGDSKVVVIVSLDPDNTVESEVHLDLTKLGLAPDAPLRVRDELTGATFTWGARNFVRLTPANPAHILVIV
ncbi:alpha-1,4-glucan--maltose-1-phosphate maltosyltransferase [Propioniciclava sp. MC1595]|nr:alpha-1,4-glucan--maltose-1-phosphate maltosyltransferase [Propioniciclava sp. MC1595]QTE27645.1 alpha-1,4-glucan--maltose-1-phosphate maltosyltransferase [Propioniciclava sp. MC1595]